MEGGRNAEIEEKDEVYCRDDVFAVAMGATCGLEVAAERDDRRSCAECADEELTWRGPALSSDEDGFSSALSSAGLLRPSWLNWWYTLRNMQV